MGVILEEIKDVQRCIRGHDKDRLRRRDALEREITRTCNTLRELKIFVESFRLLGQGSYPLAKSLTQLRWTHEQHTLGEFKTRIAAHNSLLTLLMTKTTT
jgi:hypothetical protein